MKTIGILYPGDMGGALSKKLVDAGFIVYATAQGRGTQTRHSAIANGAILKDSLKDVIHLSDIVFALVPPAAAVSCAQNYVNAYSDRHSRQIYIDCNSISPFTTSKIAAIIARADIEFIDGVFIGSSKLLGTKTQLLLSGRQANQVADLLKGTIRADCIDDRIGIASELKMCFAGFNKSLVALFIEIAYAGIKSGHWPMLSKCLNDFYPGTMQTIERLLPSYPKHVHRRVKEIEELCDYLENSKQRPFIAKDTLAIFQAIDASLDTATVELLTSKGCTVKDILLHCVHSKILEIPEK